MSNTIIIELCTEDRARLDRLAEALENRRCDSCVATALQVGKNIAEEMSKTTPPQIDEVQKALAETLAKANESVEAPKNATEEAEASTPTVTPQEEEKPTEEEPTQAEPMKKATHDDVKSLYIKLAASGKKEAARTIIMAISTTIGGIPEDKLQECYEKLVALEG